MSEEGARLNATIGGDRRHYMPFREISSAAWGVYSKKYCNITILLYTINFGIRKLVIIKIIGIYIYFIL